MTVEQTDEEQMDLRAAVTLVLGHWRAIWRTEWTMWRRVPDSDPELNVDATEVVLRWHDGQDYVTRTFERTAAGAEALATALADAGLRPPVDVTLLVDNAHILRTDMRLPRVSGSAVRGAVELELERVSPVPIAELYFDFVATPAARDKGRLDIASRAVRRRTIDNAISFAHMAGLSVAEIGLGSDSRTADWRSFPLDRSALLRCAWHKWGHVALAGLAGLLLLSILFASFARTAAETDALSDQIAATQARAMVASRLAQQIDTIHRQAAFVAGQKAKPALTGMLRTLSQVLPDGTWVTTLQLGDDGTIHLQGFSRSAADLPGLLDRTSEFSSAHFVAPLIRNDADGTERFDLTAQVRSGP
ncbi:MAG: PilN domain-containing protein [Alphaproteobacteria bacterium]|nr:PilN domain-containing protein [Alphaproteobacteria bacterium]